MEAFDENGQWLCLDAQINSNKLRGKYQSASWPISCDNYYSIFRVTMTEPDGDGDHYLCCSGFEIYGHVKVNNDLLSTHETATIEDTKYDTTDDGEAAKPTDDVNGNEEIKSDGSKQSIEQKVTETIGDLEEKHDYSKDISHRRQEHCKKRNEELLNYAFTMLKNNDEKTDISDILKNNDFNTGKIDLQEINIREFRHSVTKCIRKTNPQIAEQDSFIEQVDGLYKLVKQYDEYKRLKGKVAKTKQPV